MTSKKHEVPEELLASLLANYKKPEDLIGESGLLKELAKLLVEKALDAEQTEHLGHERHESVGNPGGNTRNGKSRKTLKGEFGELPIEVPRDRYGRGHGMPLRRQRAVNSILKFIAHRPDCTLGDIRSECKAAVSWLRANSPEDFAIATRELQAKSTRQMPLF